MDTQRACIFLLCFLSITAHVTSAMRSKHGSELDPIEQTWEIKHQEVNADGVPKFVPVVNGQFPGPELRGRSGQRLVITVINRMPMQSTTIHWHGIKQTGTPMHDGVPGVSQCAIAPGQQHVYNFTLDEPGTLWWHSHTGLQKSSLYGAIVVEGDEHSMHLRGCEEERTLLLNDWYHKSGTEQLTGLLSVPFKWVGDAQSLLINGIGMYDCDGVFGSDDARHDCLRKRAFYNSTANASGPFRLDVEYDTCYRLRVVGASSLALINFGIEGHMLRVVEAETTLLKPYETEFLDVGSGQSYSVLIQTKTKEEVRKLTNNSGKFWMQLNVRHRSNGPVGKAILTYPSASSDNVLPDRPKPKSPYYDDVQWSLNQARRQRALERTELPEATRRVKILGTQNKMADDRIVWSINNISNVDPHTPVLHAVKFGLTEETDKYVSSEWPPVEFNFSESLSSVGLSEAAESGNFVLKVKKDEVIDFVFQNTVALNGHVEFHPWHLHLHNFWVLKYGDYNTVETFEDRVGYAGVTHAVARNTFNLYPNAWVAIRVNFNNPGAAHFHCHILPHLAIGMGFVVQIGDATDIPPIPEGTNLCGSLGKLSSEMQCKA